MSTMLEAPPEPMLTVGQVADRLGVSAMTVRRWSNDGRFPAPDVRIGRFRWLASTVENWIRGGSRTAGGGE